VGAAGSVRVGSRSARVRKECAREPVPSRDLFCFPTLPRATPLRLRSVENPHPSASLRAGFLAQRTREKWGTRAATGTGTRPVQTGILLDLHRGRDQNCHHSDAAGNPCPGRSGGDRRRSGFPHLVYELPHPTACEGPMCSGHGLGYASAELTNFDRLKRFGW